MVSFDSERAAEIAEIVVHIYLSHEIIDLYLASPPATA
jgi:hypothetical protein